MACSLKEVPLFIFVCLLISSIAFSQQAEPTVAKFKLKQVRTAGVSVYASTEDWISVSAKKTIVFAVNQHGKDADAEQSLVSFSMNNKGSASGIKTLLNRVGRVFEARAVWIGGDGDSSASADKGYGLVYAVYNESYKSPPYGLPLFLDVAKFNSGGLLISPWRTLKKITFESDSYRISSSLTVARGDDSIGVAFSVNSYQQNSSFAGVSKARGYFSETDLEGEPLEEGISLPISNSGAYHVLSVRDPVWRDNRWYIPAVVNYGQRTVGPYGIDSVKNTMSEVRVHTISRSLEPGYKISSSRILKVNMEDKFRGFVFVEFLQPTESGKSSLTGKAPLLKLFVQHISLIPESERDLELYEYAFYIYSISKTGRRKGKAIPAAFPELNHVISKDGGFANPLSFEYLSHLPAGATYSSYKGNEDGSREIYFVRESLLWLRKDSNYRTENQYQLLTLNHETGAVQVLAQRTSTGQRVVSAPVGLLWLGGRIGVLTSTSVVLTDSLEILLYYTSYKP